jgi:hypothetical protein
MAKRKTRQQKIIADLRRQINASQIKSAPLEKKVEKREQPLSPSLNLPTLHLSEKKPAVSTFTNTAYLIKDLRKTAILTTSIVAVQLILLIILKNHILIFNGLVY